MKKRVESADLYLKNDRAELAEPEEKKRKFYENFCQSNLAKRKSQRL